MTDGEPRTYTGWKAGLAVVGVTTLVFAVLNVLGREVGGDREPRPAPVVTTIAP